MNFELIKNNIIEYIKEIKAMDRKVLFRRFCSVWAVIYFLSFLLLLGALAYADILPAGYLYPLLVAVALISMIIFPLLYFDYIKENRKLIALIVSVVLMIVYSVAEINLKDTADFFSRVTNVSMQTEEFYVLTAESRDLNRIEDVDKKLVGTYDVRGGLYKTAKESLASRVDVEYQMCENLSDMYKGLMEGSSDAIFLSEAHYDTMRENEKNFRKNTKVLYTMKIDVTGEDTTKRVGVTQEPFNVFVSGLDTSGDITEVSRSDVNMVVTVNPQTHTVLLTSIPRDMQIQMPSYYDANDKLTHTGIYGVQETIKSVEKLMGIDINYYVKVNYSTVTRLIDSIGGIDVVSDYAFETHGQKYYKFKKGKNHLNGKEALAFARERKAFEQGDVQRNIDQAKVMEAVLKKVTGSATILSKYRKILRSVKDYMEMNFSGTEVRALVKMQLEGAYKWTIKKQNITGYGGMDTCYSSGSYVLYVMYPDQDTVTQAAANVKNVFESRKVKKIQKEEPADSEEESAETTESTE